MAKRPTSVQTSQNVENDPRATSPRRVDAPYVFTAKYAQTEIHMSLNQTQAATLRAVQEGLEVRGAKLANGRPVLAAQDALRWLLESVGASEPALVGRE